GVIETVTRLTVGPEAIELDRTLSAAGIADLEAPAVDDLDQRMLALLPEGVATRFRDASAIPDFPSSARLLASHWQAVEGEAVDGVIAIDPATVQLVLGVIG